MREIKFRAWDKQAKKMADWQYVSTHDYLTRWIEWPERKVLMQFTGLLDKNGKEVYEGDILRVDWGIADEYLKRNKYDKPFVVEWRFYAYPPFDRYLPKPDDIEVIGNIYESPELLDKTK